MKAWCSMIILMMLGLFFVSCGEQSQQGGQGSSGYMGIVMIVAIFAVFYFLLIYPKQREQKKHAQMLSELKKGDEVITTSGMHGKVVGVSDRVVVLRISEDCKVEFERTHIATIVRK